VKQQTHSYPLLLRGEWRYHEPLAAHTTWRVGGLATRLYRPADIADLRAVLAYLDPQEPICYLGLGSNVLVSEQGFQGTVIQLQRFKQIRIHRDTLVRVAAGVSCAKMVRFAIQHELVGLEWLIGIPGTIGGALAMNAGAWGSSTWEFVTKVWTINRAGHLQVRYPQEFTIGYRSVHGLDQEWFLGAEFALLKGNRVHAQERCRELLAQRASRQPIGLATAGSVFRNHVTHSAGYLIEAAGLKGFSYGAVQISEQHANFIINRGQAKATEIAQLITIVQQQVLKHSGVMLQPEICFIGDF
jgi:UDP-N-acetylmuramate dehydrogenase